MNIIPKTTIGYMSNLALVGAIFVSFGYPLIANIIWSITNPYLMWYNRKINQPEQAKMFFIYFLITLFGVYNLWPK